MNTKTINAMMEYLDKHGVGEFMVDGAAEIEAENLSRRDRREILAAWEVLEGDPDAPPGVAGIVAHNINEWGEALWPGQRNKTHAVILSNSEIESLVDFIEQTATEEWKASVTLGAAQTTLSDWLPRITPARNARATR